MVKDSVIKTLQLDAISYLEKNLSNVYTYHNAQHSREVCQAVNEFALQMPFTCEERQIIEVAAIFHDFGYLESAFDNERLSLGYMVEFGRKYGLPDELITRANHLILETRFPYHPVTAAGELLCDADIEYIGRKSFRAKAELFRQESAALGITFSDKAWWQMELDFLLQNSFFTAVCREKRSGGRWENIMLVKERLRQLKNGEQ